MTHTCPQDAAPGHYVDETVALAQLPARLHFHSGHCKALPLPLSLDERRFTVVEVLPPLDPPAQPGNGGW